LHGAPWTPDTARDEARRLLGEVVKGHDPAAAKEAVRKAPLVEELIDQYLAAARSGKLLTGRGRAKKPSTIETDAYRLAAHVIPAIGHLKVNGVSRHDIERLRDRLMDDGGGAARTLGLVDAVFQFSVRKGLRVDNPVRGIDWPLGRGKALAALSKTVRRIIDASGLPADISAHTLRHSFASVAADLGMSELTIAALLGHSAVSVTSRAFSLLMESRWDSHGALFVIHFPC
jgi:site-specific recombinase XerD